MQSTAKVGDRVMIIKGFENISPKPTGIITKIHKNGRVIVVRRMDNVDIATHYNPPTSDRVDDWDNPPDLILWNH